MQNTAGMSKDCIKIETKRCKWDEAMSCIISQEMLERYGCCICGACWPDCDCGHTGLTGMQVQLQEDVESIAPGKPVVFNKIISSYAPYITYDHNGTFTIKKSATLFISWWVAADGICTCSDCYITFMIESSDGHKVRASSPVMSGLLHGTALIGIKACCKRPVTIRLVNDTNGYVGCSPARVKAELTIVSTARPFYDF